MKKMFLFFIMLLTLTILSSCTFSQSLQYDIITTLFPQYDIAKTLGQEDFNVYNVLPIGASPHSYEITSKDIESISNASLFLYTSDAVEPWVKKLILTSTTVVNVFERVEENVELYIDEEHVNNHDHDGEDPHYWTHPLGLLEMVQIIKSEMIALRSDLTELIESRAAELTSSLEAEFDLLNVGLENLNLLEPTLYIAGHNALAYYADYFNLHIESMFPDFIPDAELTSAQLESFMNVIQSNQVSYFFVEPYFQEQPLAAQLIQNALSELNYSVRFEQIYQFHNVGSVEILNNDTLLTLLAHNRLNILESLGQNNG